MRGLIGFSLLPLLASSAPTTSSFSTETIHEGAAPILSSSNADVIADSYIVVFKKHVTEASANGHHNWVKGVHSASESSRTELRKRSQFPITEEIFDGLKHTYNIAGSFLGYSGHFDDSVIEQVRRHPDVSSLLTPLPFAIVDPWSGGGRAAHNCFLSYAQFLLCDLTLHTSKVAGIHVMIQLLCVFPSLSTYLAIG